MDNLTHSITGLLIAEGLLQTRVGRDAPRGFRLAAQLVSGLSNNLPDFDFLFAGRGVEYLLHHRGHTHTLLLGLPLGLLALVPVWWWRRKREGWDARYWRWLLALALFGPLVHLLLDFSNNYGIHPFWPLSKRWFFGDAVFIVEPWFLVLALPPLWHTAQSRAGRIVYGVLLALVPVLCVLSGRVPLALVVALVISAALVWLGCGRLGPARGVALGIGGCLAVCAGWFALSAHVRGAFARELASRFPDTEVQDLVVTPLPANPFCYNALSVERDGQDYLVRRALVASMPGLIEAGRCPRITSPSAPLEPVPAASSPRLVWGGQFRAPLAELRALARACQPGAYLRWSRAPFWTSELIGDLRYDFSADRDFAELPLDPERCPRHVPDWIPPRAGLLAP